MNLQINVVITGDKRVKQKMKRLGSSLYNFTSAMDDIGKSGEKYFSNIPFLTQGNVFGSEWPALSNRTIRARKRRTSVGSSGTQALITGNPNGMQFSFASDSGRNYVIIGNTKSHFKYHQSTRPRRVLPRRQMIGVTKGFRKIAHDIIQNDVRKKIRAA